MRLANLDQLRHNQKSMKQPIRIFFLAAFLLTVVYPAMSYVPEPDRIGVAGDYHFQRAPHSEPISETIFLAPSIAEWSSGQSFSGCFTIGYGNPKPHVPGFVYRWFACNGNPVNYTDPTGMVTYTEHGGANIFENITEGENWWVDFGGYFISDFFNLNSLAENLAVANYHTESAGTRGWSGTKAATQVAMEVAGGEIVGAVLRPVGRLVGKVGSKIISKFGDDAVDTMVNASNFIAKSNARGSGTIVIGEGMGSVKNAARSLRTEGINAKWYQAWSKYFPEDRLMTPDELEAALARNARWIKSKIKAGYQIFDLGIDATKATRSPFYQLEKDILHQYTYPTIPMAR